MPEIASLKDTLEKYQLLAKKSLGQNFLLDTNITDKIVRSCLRAQELADFSSSHVYEVGPGPGGLTRAILKANPQKLTVVEMDSRCIRIMQELQDAVGEKLEIFEGDALNFDFATDTSSPCHIISNLPYNISVPLLINWLKEMQCFCSLTLMFQKEVAERIMAPVGNKSYGRISVLAQLVCNVERLFDLNPSCFVPAPKIWSSVLLFKAKQQHISATDICKLEKITSLAFGQRRKMIRQSLKTLPDLENLCQKAQIDLTLRAENITPQQYLTLAQNAQL